MMRYEILHHPTPYVILHDWKFQDVVSLPLSGAQVPRLSDSLFLDLWSWSCIRIVSSYSSGFSGMSVISAAFETHWFVGSVEDEA